MEVLKSISGCSGARPVHHLTVTVAGSWRLGTWAVSGVIHFPEHKLVNFTRLLSVR